MGCQLVYYDCIILVTLVKSSLSHLHLESPFIYFPHHHRYVEEATAATVFILDETIAKIGLQMRIDHLEEGLARKADGHVVADMNSDIRSVVW